MRILPARLAPPAAPVALCVEEGADRLIPVLESRLVFNGVATTKVGRTFPPLQRHVSGQGIEVAGWVGGQPRPFPDAAWNNFPAQEEPAHAFVGVNPLRIGPDDQLWIVDKGVPGPKQDVLSGGAKVVVVDLPSNTVSRTMPLDAVTGRKSFRVQARNRLR